MVDSMHIGTEGMFPQIQHWRVIVLQNLAPTLIKTQLPDAV